VTITDETALDQANAVSVDLYRDIHKGIRAELFAVTGEAGRLDPASGPARVALADYVRGVVDTLEAHAAHEDAGVQPVLEEQLPDLAVRIHDDHERLAPRAAALIDLADEAAEATGSSRAEASHRLYLELADFTGTYLLHQDVEERIVLPALRTAIGPREILAIHGAIIASIPPDQMARSLAFMLPAMNIDGRAELLAGMRAGAPPRVFEGVWGLAASVLAPADHAALAERLGVA
jgi:Hemerythrin HHE cation binding domain